MPIVQDAPPPGGFPTIRIERRLPSTGPTGVAIFAGLAAIMGYGFYKVCHACLMWLLPAFLVLTDACFLLLAQLHEQRQEKRCAWMQ